MRLPTVLLGVLSISLVASTALNAALFGRAKQYYLESNATRLDPLGLSQYSSLPVPKADEAEQRVVIFGDSRAQGWPAPTVDGYSFINRGLGSQTSTQVLQRFSAHVVPLEPDIIVLQVGINDLKAVALFPERAELIVEECQENIKQLVSLSEATGATVIVMSILPAGDITLARRPFWSSDIDRAVAEVNLFIADLVGSQSERAEDLAEESKTVFFDGAIPLVDEIGKIKPIYQLDELHLNGAGYKVLNEAFVLKLQSLRG